MQDVGGAFARFTLKIDELEKNYDRAITLIDQLEARVSQPLEIRIRVDRKTAQQAFADMSLSARRAAVEAQKASNDIGASIEAVGKRRNISRIYEVPAGAAARIAKVYEIPNATVQRIAKMYDAPEAAIKRISKIYEQLLAPVPAQNVAGQMLAKSRVAKVYDSGDQGPVASAVAATNAQNAANAQNAQILQTVTNATKEVDAVEQARLVTLAKLQRQLRDFKSAYDTFGTAQSSLTKGTAEHNVLETQRVAIQQQALSVIRKHADGDIAAAKAAGDYDQALRLLNKQLANAVLSHDKLRETQIRTEQTRIRTVKAANSSPTAAIVGAAPITRTPKEQDALDRQEGSRLRSLASLQRGNGEYAASFATLTQAQSLYAENSSQWNRLESLKSATMRQGERINNQYADSTITAARSARDFARAIALINKEVAIAASKGDLTRVARLQSELSQVQRASQTNIFSNVAKGALALVGPLSAAYAAANLFRSGVRQMNDSIQLAATLDANRRAIGAFLQSVNRGDAIFAASIQFAEKYRIAYSDMGEAAQDASLIMRTSNASAEETFSVLARLLARQPTKTFQDAVRSVVELQSGQLQSIERVFNIPQRFAQEMEKAIEAGADPIETLDALLNRLGNTARTLETRTVGVAGAQFELANAVAAAKLNFADAASGPYTAFLNILTQTIKGTNLLVADLNRLDNVNFGNVIANFQKLNGAQTSSFTENTGEYLIQSLILGYASLSIEAETSAEKQAEANTKVVKSIEQIQAAAIAATPDLRRFLPKESPQRQEYDAEIASNTNTQSIDDTIAKLNVLNNKYDELTIGAVEYNAKFDLLTRSLIKGAPELPFLETVLKDFPEGKKRLEELQTLRVQLSNKIGDPSLTTQEKITFIAEFSDVLDAITEIEAKAPKVIEVEMQIKLTNEIGRIAGEMASATDQLAKDQRSAADSHAESIGDLYKSHDTALADFHRSEARTLRDFNSQQVTAQRDFSSQQLESDAGFLRQRGQARRDFNLQQVQADASFARSQALSARNFNQQLAESDSDFARSRATAVRDYNQSLARANRDFAFGEARALRDFNRGEARLNEDADRAAQRLKRDRNREDERGSREHLRNLQMMRRDFDIDGKRSEEDYQRERRRLLAEGKVYEAGLLKEKFDIERQRAGEDFGRNRSDASDQFANQNFEKTGDRQRQDADAAEDAARSRDRRLIDFANARADAREDFARQQADQAIAFAQQQADAAANHALQRARSIAAFEQQNADALAAHALQRQEAQAAFALQEADAQAAHNLSRQQAQAAFELQRADAKTAFDLAKADRDTDHARALADIGAQITAENEKYAAQQITLRGEYNKHLAALTREFELFQQKQARIDDLIAKHVEEKQAEVIATMEQSVAELERIGLKQGAASQLGGYKVGLAWAQGLGKALTDYATDPSGVGAALSELEKRLQGNSPPPRGPLSNIDIGGFNVGKAWREGFRKGIGNDLTEGLDGLVRARIDAENRTIDILQRRHGIEINLDRNSHIKRLAFIEQEIERRRSADLEHGSIPGERYTNPIYNTTPRDITPWVSNRGSGGGDYQSGPAQQRQIINLNIPLGINVDGKSLGDIVAPHVATAFMAGAEIALNVVQASETIALQQSSFRSEL